VTCAEAGVPITAIAVTSSTNPTRDAHKSYLGDGIAQEVMNTFNSIPGLDLSTRTSTRSTGAAMRVFDRLPIIPASARSSKPVYAEPETARA